MERTQQIEQIERDIQLMMSRAGQILMDHVKSLSDERLQQFAEQFDENHRTMLLNELTSTMAPKE